MWFDQREVTKTGGNNLHYVPFIDKISPINTHLFWNKSKDKHLHSIFSVGDFLIPPIIEGTWSKYLTVVKITLKVNSHYQCAVTFWCYRNINFSRPSSHSILEVTVTFYRSADWTWREILEIQQVSKNVTSFMIYLPASRDHAKYLRNFDSVISQNFSSNSSLVARFSRKKI